MKKHSDLLLVVVKRTHERNESGAHTTKERVQKVFVIYFANFYKIKK